jgi:fructosamine-3-kinase
VASCRQSSGPASPDAGGSGSAGSSVPRTLCAKVHLACDEDMFPSEATSLRILRERGLGVPAVLATSPMGLVLEHVEQGRPQWRAAAAQVAALHAPLPRTLELAYGSPSAVFLGLARLEGTAPADSSWCEFFKDHRMLPALRRAESIGGAVGEELRCRRVRERVEAVLTQPLPVEEGPCLLHGDLWSGNLLHAKRRRRQSHSSRAVEAAGTGEVVFIDAGVWVGERAVELAQMELYGTFPDAFWNEYRRLRPISSKLLQCLPRYRLFFLLMELWHQRPASPTEATLSEGDSVTLAELDRTLAECEMQVTGCGRAAKRVRVAQGLRCYRDAPSG